MPPCWESNRESSEDRRNCHDVPIYAFVMARKKSPDSPDTAQSQIFVRRGALRRFDKLTKAAEHLPVAVKWDRRTDERRSASKSVSTDARKSERRQQPPFTWKVADFVVAETTTRGPRPNAKRKRATRASR